MLAAAAVCGFILDLLFGDPSWMPHPVVYMGKAISWLEKMLRRRLPDTPEGQLTGGTILIIIMAAGTLLLGCLCCWVAHLIHPILAFLLQIFWCWQCLAMRGLGKESRRVCKYLSGGRLERARKAVGRIVGRDTDELTEEGVARAAVESVAENFSDGEIAPLLWFLVGGAPLALCYKAVNTMDSMMGYKNPSYLYFGRRAAKLDDIANWIPARLSALLLIAAARPAGADAQGAMRIWRRDRRNHPSPNSAQAESAMAGALDIQLGGPARYSGRLEEKPTVGDPLRPVTPDEISRADRLMYVAGVLGLVLLCLLRILCVFLIRLL
ncbi:MAG: adenosylcobinamide-phosphate synthase CbiB [Oscillospiraceae bacterium]|nr:adenosylcobinamide-phosphate synthase CbiB [Oscillospiraceae bacterium]